MTMQFNSYITPFCAYFEEGFAPLFREKYKGVIVNAINDSGEGHFAIRKPITFWFKLPKFIKHMFPYKWVMYKNRKEKLHQLRFRDHELTVEMVADTQNSSYKKLTFDLDTYLDLKQNLPPFLELVGFKFDTLDHGGDITLMFD